MTLSLDKPKSFITLSSSLQIFIYNYLNMVVLSHLEDILWNFNFSYSKAFNNLKKVFISISILIYWISNTQLIIETDISNYAFAAILSIMIKHIEVYLVVFYFCIFKTAKLNYSTYDKKLLTIFRIFWI